MARSHTEAGTAADHGSVVTPYRSESTDEASDVWILADLYGAWIDGRAVSLDTVITPEGYPHLRVNGKVLFL